MEQKSDVHYRAEKEYKNSRGKFVLLLREIISNSIHAVLIRQNKENNFNPKLELNIDFDEEQEKCKIELTDNGEGFTDKNRDYFEKFDKRNAEKLKLNFHPLGQGRLAIIYFSDFAEYETVYKGKDGALKKRRMPYPPEDEGNKLFSCDDFAEENPKETDSFTKLTIEINKVQSFGRAKTFFKKYPDIASIKQWFIETFFPFIVSNDNLKININYNGSSAIIQKDDVEENTQPLSFEILLSENEEEKAYKFRLWLIKTAEKSHRENPIVCFARNLQVELSTGELTYSIDCEYGHLFYLTSNYFDEQVDTRGEKLEISDMTLTLINSKVNEVLNDNFKMVIEQNKKSTERNFKAFKTQYPSLKPFVEELDILNSKNIIIKEEEIIKTAIEEKGKIEKEFWTHETSAISDEKEDNFDDSIKYQKLLNSSLHIYVKHRKRILKQLHDLIQKFDNEGNDKPELEGKVHELFFRRGETLTNSDNINHLHNLWILDDKFTIFSNDFKAQSTKQGQSLLDIYIWADNPTRTKEILILELKSTTHAHNSGDRNESMIPQVKRYAKDFFKNPTKFLNWDVETKSVLYTSVILARKEDINKELRSNNISGYKRIPFLPNSFYLDDTFVKPNAEDPMDTVPIRIELYSFEDIYELASSRNGVFFKLLQNEFEISRDSDNL